MILFDTGMGSHPEVDAHYRPRRVGLREALAAIGAQICDIRLAANCHLHFDHCGGNPLLGQIPVFVQEAELGTARRAPDYTLPELIEASRFEQVAGQAEMLPGVFLMPTPGHTDGHQSLIVRRPDGAVIVAGQSHDTATGYAADQLAWQAHRDAHGQPLPGMPDWIDALQQLNPRIVYFAHDRSVWGPLTQLIATPDHRHIRVSGRTQSRAFGSRYRRAGGSQIIRSRAAWAVDQEPGSARIAAVTCAESCAEGW